MQITKRFPVALTHDHSSIALLIFNKVHTLKFYNYLYCCVRLKALYQLMNNYFCSNHKNAQRHTNSFKPSPHTDTLPQIKMHSFNQCVFDVYFLYVHGACTANGKRLERVIT